MRTTLIAALLCLASLDFPNAHAQHNERERARFQEYKVRAEKGDADAQFLLGGCYHSGEGVPRDDKEAAKWVRRAAEQNHTRAQAILGYCYFKGEGVPRNYPDPQAQTYLGASYFYGLWSSGWTGRRVPVASGHDYPHCLMQPQSAVGCLLAAMRIWNSIRLYVGGVALVLGCFGVLIAVLLLPLSSFSRHFWTGFSPDGPGMPAAQREAAISEGLQADVHYRIMPLFFGSVILIVYGFCEIHKERQT